MLPGNERHRIKDNGKQQEPSEKTDGEEEPGLYPKGDIQEPNAGIDGGSQNGNDLVQMPVLRELPSNERKRHKTAEKLKFALELIGLCLWEFMAILGADCIEVEGVYLNAFLTAANLVFIIAGGWFMYDCICARFFGKM